MVAQQTMTVYPSMSTLKAAGGDDGLKQSMSFI